MPSHCPITAQQRRDSKQTAQQVRRQTIRSRPPRNVSNVWNCLASLCPISLSLHWPPDNHWCKCGTRLHQQKNISLRAE